MTTLPNALLALAELTGRVYPAAPNPVPILAYAVWENGHEAVSALHDAEGRQQDRVKRFVTVYLYVPGDRQNPGASQKGADSLYRAVGDLVNVVSAAPDLQLTGFSRSSGGHPPLFDPATARWTGICVFSLSGVRG